LLYDVTCEAMLLSRDILHSLSVKFQTTIVLDVKCYREKGIKKAGKYGKCLNV